MKIAACFSGRIRNFEDTFPYFKKNLFDKYDVDTFFFGSPNKNGLHQNLCEFKKLYKPKKIIINNHDYYNKLDSEYKFGGPISKMWCNIYNSNKLREQYEEENNFKYDYVFRIRPDFFFIRRLKNIGINLCEIDDNSIMIPYKWNFPEIHPMGKSDIIAMGTSISMSKYANLFKNINKFVNETPIMYTGNPNPHPESLLGIYLNSININVIPIESPVECEYPDEIDIGSVKTSPPISNITTELEYRANYRSFAFD